MKKNHLIIVIFLLTIIVGVIYFLISRSPDLPNVSKSSQENSVDQNSSQQPVNKLAYPIKNFNNNQTKKTFGQLIDPATSPVQPEKFSGYHTGVDVEASPADLSRDVLVYSISSGKVKYVGRVSGYGGVVIVQYTINSEAVTALYGHVKLSSVTKKVGQSIGKGKQLAILGRGYSSETDGERKHLHFSVHKGTAIELRGYVQSQSELSAWIDPNNLYK